MTAVLKKPFNLKKISLYHHTIYIFSVTVQGKHYEFRWDTHGETLSNLDTLEIVETDMVSGKKFKRAQDVSLTSHSVQFLSSFFNYVLTATSYVTNKIYEIVRYFIGPVQISTEPKKELVLA